MSSVIDNINEWKKENRLMYLKIVRLKEGPKELWGRIINFDENSKDILVYNDDDKKIHNINFSEIEIIEPSKRN